MYCQNCGTENTIDAKFCQQCGCGLIEIVENKKESTQSTHKSKKLIPALIALVINFSISSYVHELLLCSFLYNVI